MSTAERILPRLRELNGLQAGWHDGAGDAVSFDVDLAAKAITSLAIVFGDDFGIFPTFEGELQIEWMRRENGEVHCGPEVVLRL